MTAILLELAFILFLAIVNGLLAMSEMALVSSRKARLRQYAADGDARAQVALELAEEPTRFLSAIQIGITLVGILAGALGGATIARELGRQLQRVPLLAPYGEALAFGVVVVGITYLSLVLGELVPKRFALGRAERTALAVAVPMRRLCTLVSPIVRLLSASTELVLRFLGVRAPAEPSVTEEEVALMIDEGAQLGVFEQVERDIVRRVFRLGDRKVGSLMTHRTDMVWLDLDDRVDETAQLILHSSHSRFPVARGGLDNVLGVVQAKDLLAQILAGQSLDVKTVLQPPLFVPEGALAWDVLERFKESGLHMALVIDEYGGLEGVLTLNDVLEALVGDLPPLDEVTAPGAVQRSDGSWLLDGSLSIDEFKALFGLEDLPGEVEGHFETLGGFVMSFLGRIPTAADHFSWQELCFEIMDMDGHRVDKVLVFPPKGGVCARPANRSVQAEQNG